MNRIFRALRARNQTLLCVGPLSPCIIQSALEISAEKKSPIVFIASRSQIEAREFGGGYVNGWDTESFVGALPEGSGTRFWLARDHGGPGQGLYERRNALSPGEAIKAAKKSLEVDIDSGFHFLHLDPSLPVGDEALEEETVKERLKDLFLHVVTYAKSRRGSVDFSIEVGTEEQCGNGPDPEKFEQLLKELSEFTRENHLPMPLYMVLQTGTRVVGRKNIGIFSQGQEARKPVLEKIKTCVEIADSFGCLVKEHNGDYLSSDDLKLRPQLGIAGCNVAPEFGSAETEVILKLLKDAGHPGHLAEVKSLILNAGHWRKWFLPDEAVPDEEKILVGGHYCFSHPRFREVREDLRLNLNEKRLDLDQEIKAEVKKRMARYLEAFGF